MNTSAPSNVYPIPNLRVTNEVREETIPKANNGSVVNNPNIEFESPVASRIWLTNGPTVAIAGRKLMAINKMPAINRKLPELVLLCFDKGIPERDIDERVGFVEALN